jgi:hypothetical protein
LNDNDAKLTDLITAQSGSTVEDNAPNAPAQPGFDLVVEAVAGHAIGNGGGPYTLTITAIDLTTVAAAPALQPVIPAQSFDLGTGWKPNGLDFVYNNTFPIAAPAGGPFAGHTLQYVGSLVNKNAQVVSIIESEPFVLV